MMLTPVPLKCDGCGQAASAQHLARRLQRLEWSTRRRPVHIQTLLLGAVSPELDTEFFYSPQTSFSGEAALFLDIAGITPSGKSADAIQTEFQRAGFFVTHVLECPLEGEGSDRDVTLPQLLALQTGPAIARIRRSLKPKRVAFVSGFLKSFADKFTGKELAREALSDGSGFFPLDGSDAAAEVSRLRGTL